MNKSRTVMAGFICLIASVLVGCGKSSDAIASKRSKVFDSASPQIKSEWENAAAAAKAHDYATAISNLNLLASDANLTPEQLQAARDTGRAVSDEMYAALNKGDENAKKAIEELRKSMTR